MIFETIVISSLAVMFAACAYCGIFGIFLWKWTRIPFAFAGGLLLSIGMNGVPVIPVRDEDEDEKEQVVEVETPAEPGNPDDQFGRQLFALKGMTPLDVKNAVVSQAKSGASNFEENDDEPQWQQERESKQEFIARKRQERGAA